MTNSPSMGDDDDGWESVLSGDKVSSQAALAVVIAFIPWNLMVSYAMSRRHRWPNAEGFVGCLAFIGILVPVSMARFAELSTVRVLQLSVILPCMLGSCLFGCRSQGNLVQEPAVEVPPGEAVDWESKLILKQVLPPVNKTVSLSTGSGEGGSNNEVDNNGDGSDNNEDDNNDNTNQAELSYGASRPKVDIVLPTDEVCEICLDDFVADDTIAWSGNEACHHVYHKDCLLEWLAQGRSGACPICRVEF
jgi:hypothetical protein